MSEETSASPVDQSLLQRLGPLYTALSLYSRLAVTGVERVPASGPAILAANHTGWLGLDYAFTALSLYKTRGRMPRGLVHDAWFANPRLADFASRLGLVRISKDGMRDLVRQGEVVMVFPEGQEGAFKVGENYNLQDFARGYVRVAMETGAPIVPVAILGGEEANPVLGHAENYKELLGSPLPIPSFPFLPKPVKWRLRFLPPVEIDMRPDDATDRDKVHALSERIRGSIQSELETMRRERGNRWF